jgi:hypothetical protein
MIAVNENKDRSMSAPEGLQFPIDPETHHASTSRTGKQIISEALALVDNKLSQQVLKEKTGASVIHIILRQWCIKVFYIRITRSRLPVRVYTRHINYLNFTATINITR